MNLSGQDQKACKEVAREAILQGVESGRIVPPTLNEYPPLLCQPAATFVTLQKAGDLRGCIGHLEATLPLVQDVAENAFSAAFHDTRFPPVSRDELSDLSIKISILTAPEPLPFESESHLLSVIRPGDDGLIFHAENRRSVLLPSVWPMVNGPEEFLGILKRKAGFSLDYWRDDVRMQRFVTVEF